MGQHAQITILINVKANIREYGNQVIEVVGQGRTVLDYKASILPVGKVIFT